MAHGKASRVNICMFNWELKGAFLGCCIRGHFEVLLKARPTINEQVKFSVNWLPS